jgi:hypothetical protein
VVSVQSRNLLLTAFCLAAQSSMPQAVGSRLPGRAPLEDPKHHSNPSPTPDEPPSTSGPRVPRPFRCSPCRACPHLSLLVQSASFPGSVLRVSTFLRRTSSRALRAASAARAAMSPLATMAARAGGCCSSHSPSWVVTTLSTMRLTWQAPGTAEKGLVSMPA